MEIAVDVGAEDLDTEDADFVRVYTAPDELHQVKEALEANGVEIEAAEFEMEPSTTQRLEGKQAQQMVRLMEAFDDHDDVQNVWANFDIDDEILAGA
jgi:transcriptional/translational regulatory protein YebC/TACO1